MEMEATHRGRTLPTNLNPNPNLNWRQYTEDRLYQRAISEVRSDIWLRSSRRRYLLHWRLEVYALAIRKVELLEVILIKRESNPNPNPNPN